MFYTHPTAGTCYVWERLLDAADLTQIRAHVAHRAAADAQAPVPSFT